MFLNSVIKRNPLLIEESIRLLQRGHIRPDSFVVDLDTLLKNARKILHTANQYQMELYFMTKQLGRNPVIAQKLVELGYVGAVVVDYKEADLMMKYHIPIAHIGHLVQIPNRQIEKLMQYGVGIITVYSLEKAALIDSFAKQANFIQDISLRIVGEEDHLYSGQEAGILLKDLPTFVAGIRKYKNIRIHGLTVFPAILFDETLQTFQETANIATMMEAKERLASLGIHVKKLNMPSGTCCESIPKIAGAGGNVGEPGHGLTATTPAHAGKELEEVPAVVYVSEVSHNFRDKAYYYGGGVYRRGHHENVLVIPSEGERKRDKVVLPNLDSIDYHIGLEHTHNVGDIVIALYRFQMFVSRSDLVLVEGLQTSSPTILGIFNTLGERL